MNIRMLTILSAASLLVGFAARADEPTLTERIDNANVDLMKAQAPIPHLELHNRGLEILRTIPAVPPVVAKDDDDAKAKAESCVAFKTTPMQYTTCK